MQIRPMEKFKPTDTPTRSVKGALSVKRNKPKSPGLLCSEALTTENPAFKPVSCARIFKARALKPILDKNIQVNGKKSEALRARRSSMQSARDGYGASPVSIQGGSDGDGTSDSIQEITEEWYLESLDHHATTYKGTIPKAYICKSKGSTDAERKKAPIISRKMRSTPSNFPASPNCTRKIRSLRDIVNSHASSSNRTKTGRFT